MKDRASFFTSWMTFLIVFAVLMVLVIGFAQRFDQRLDLTSAKIYTVSDSTKEILGGLTDVVTIQYYVSEKLPTMLQDLPRDTRDFLREYERLSGGNVRYEVVDPDELIADYVREKEEESGDKEGESELMTFSPFGGPQGPRQEKEQELAMMGVHKLQGQVIEDDDFKIASFFSSIVVRYLDKPAETITQHTDLVGLEYELANRILKLTSTDRPKVAFFLGKPDDKEMTPHPQFPDQLPPMETHPYQPLLDQVFSNTVEVEEVLLTEESPIPADARILIVAEPHVLNRRQVYEIDRYIVGGGTVMIWASYTTGDITSGRWGMTPLQPGLKLLFEAWGIEMERDLVFSIQCGPVMRQQRIGIGNLVADAPGPWPPCPMAVGPHVDQQSTITAGLNGIVFPYASPLTYDEDRTASLGLDVRVLARSSEQSWRTPWAPALTGEILNPPEANGTFTFQGSFDLAYLIEGTFPSPYEAGDEVPSWPQQEAAESSEMEDGAAEGEGGKPTTAPKEDAPPEKIPQIEARPGRVILCSSADMAKVQYLGMEGYGANVQFFNNVVESYGLGRGLDQIRQKQQSARPIEDLTRGEKNTILLSLMCVPLLLVVFGIARYLKRRSAARAYEERFLQGGAS